MLSTRWLCVVVVVFWLGELKTVVAPCPEVVTLPYTCQGHSSGVEQNYQVCDTTCRTPQCTTYQYPSWIGFNVNAGGAPNGIWYARYLYNAPSVTNYCQIRMCQLTISADNNVDRITINGAGNVLQVNKLLGYQAQQTLAYLDQNGTVFQYGPSAVNEFRFYINNVDTTSSLRVWDFSCSTTDVNECLSNNGGCPTGTQCVNRFGAAVLCQDINECESNACGAGYTCANIVKTSGSSSASPGYTCTDINECSTNNGGCCTTDGDGSGLCDNGVAFWNCTNTVGGRLCADINECVVNPDACPVSSGAATCTNRPGYVLCQDYNECTNNNGFCGNAQYITCINQNLAARNCVDVNECATGHGGCGAGYECANQFAAPPLCINVNECAANPCPNGTVCQDQLGAPPVCADLNECEVSFPYQQVCSTGFYCVNVVKTNESTSVDQGYTCLDYNECGVANGECCAFFHEESNPLCDNGASAFLCTNTPGAHYCQDVDECNTTTYSCFDAVEQGQAVCVNGNGFYRCDDINECLNQNGFCGDPLYIACVNQHFAPRLCVDINECDVVDCANGTTCVNLHAQPSQCVDFNECGVNHGGCANGTACEDQPDPLPPVCGDVDVCALTLNGGCPLGTQCIDRVNTVPLCLDVNECLLPDKGGCVSGYYCDNLVKSGSSIDSDPGYECRDINECMQTNGGCCSTNGGGAALCSNSTAAWTCVNTPGSRTCIGVDECASVDQEVCPTANGQATCRNFNGYYQCDDVNECRVSNGYCGDAQYVTCANQHFAPRTCTDINECDTANGNCGAMYNCTNRYAAPPTCTPPPAADVNECLTANGGCPLNTVCANQVNAPVICFSGGAASSEDNKATIATALGISLVAVFAVLAFAVWLCMRIRHRREIEQWRLRASARNSLHTELAEVSPSVNNREGLAIREDPMDTHDPHETSEPSKVAPAPVPAAPASEPAKAVAADDDSKRNNNPFHK